MAGDRLSRSSPGGGRRHRGRGRGRLRAGRACRERVADAPTRSLATSPPRRSAADSRTP